MVHSSYRARQIAGIVMLLTILGESFVVPSVPSRPKSSRLIVGSTGRRRRPSNERTKSMTSSSSPRQQKEDHRTVSSSKKERLTIGELRKQMEKNPSYFESNSNGSRSQSKSRRTRKRAENPQQKYVYKAQRVKLSQDQPVDLYDDNDVPSQDQQQQQQQANVNPALVEAKRLGMVNVANQHCDAPVDNVVPEILGRVLVIPPTNESDPNDQSPSSYAYLINKPVGWSILGGRSKNKSNNKQDTNAAIEKASPSSTTKSARKKQKSRHRVKIVDEDENEEYLEFDESEIYALLTPEEREELESELAGGKSLFDGSSKTPIYDDSSDVHIPGWDDVANMNAAEREEAGIEDDDYDPDDIVPFDEAEVAQLMADIEGYENEHSPKHDPPSQTQQSTAPIRSSDDRSLDKSVRENLKRIETRAATIKSHKASFAAFQRPSVVSWLKETKAAEGQPIRGGNYWTAIAGAVDVDDSGLVLIVPKAYKDNIFVDYTDYVAVIGNGNFLAPKMKKKRPSVISDTPYDLLTFDLISKVKKGRDGDIPQTVRIGVTEGPSTCDSIIQSTQGQFLDGIRGDPAANPFDRRAPRRLIHCNSMTVSSLVVDDSSDAEVDPPDDIRVLSDRLNNHKYRQGSFLGRQSLQENPMTTAYREINGAADGFPGWTVDRYGEYLFIQHDEKEYRGPVPSIHDGNTAGVYILPASADRGAMGSRDKVRPRLMEGKPAPSIIPVLENGITYLVSLDRDLSTGIFLDQRPQRAWLARNCNSATHVLNCFAHCGAFSVAAASAGASTVSLDLNKKWLDRIEPQFDANGIVFDERHDCIYGDVFEWLGKLAKRGEKYDIVILDPPSSSVGKKKRRWSVKNDFDELVQLAVPLVKKGGLLWTTTNSASLSPIRFASLCQRGFEAAGIPAKLEKIQPSPVDFPTVGSQAVKNLVWRIG